jgi:hypothetical protein
MATEAEVATALEAVTRRQPVMIKQTKDFVRAAVNYRMCELALALELFVIAFCKSSINPIINPNPIYSHTNKRENIFSPTTEANHEENTTVRQTIELRA